MIASHSTNCTLLTSDVPGMAVERGNAETSVSELFEYKISYHNDGTLQWHPLAGSKELALALSYHFPEEKDMKEKMRAAIKEFLRDQRKRSMEKAGLETLNSAFNYSGDNDGERQEAPNRPNLQILSWDPVEKNFQGNRKPTKRRYGKIEGAKVAANRGYACDFHRKQKSKVGLIRFECTMERSIRADRGKCDPDTCPRNKLRLQNLAKSQEKLAGLIIPPNALTSREAFQEASRPSMPDSSIADRHINQASEDAVYPPQGDSASIITTGFAVSNTDLSS